MNTMRAYRVGRHLSGRSPIRNFHRYVIIFWGGGEGEEEAS